MKARLMLEDGFTLEGESVTGEFETGGEVIFTTGMTGYQEVLTDPSYCGQLVCMTWPLIGNYGVTRKDMESKGIHAAALLVKECCKQPSNWRAELSLPDFLLEQGAPCMEGLDTRALARHLRMHGAMRGIISTKDADLSSLREKAQSQTPMQGNKLVPRVACKSPYTWKNNQAEPVDLTPGQKYQWQGSGLPLLVYDYGIKWNILRHLEQAGFEILCVPPDFSAEAAIATGAAGVFLSNGPGDPATLSEEAAIVTELCQKMPVVGICLGHQLIAQALGAKTGKLKFGHHGCNHPVQDIATGRIEISSQNHGFHVLPDLPEELEVTHINLNDGTIEGLRHKTLPVMSLQYHPEAAAGPRDANHLFRRFHQIIAGQPARFATA